MNSSAPASAKKPKPVAVDDDDVDDDDGGHESEGVEEINDEDDWEESATLLWVYYFLSKKPSFRKWSLKEAPVGQRLVYLFKDVVSLVSPRNEFGDTGPHLDCH